MTINVPGKRVSRNQLRHFRKIRSRAPAAADLQYQLEPSENWNWPRATVPVSGQAVGGAASPTNAGALSTSDTGAPPSAPLGGRLKRFVDVVLALTVLVLASPVMLIVALSIRIATGGPALYSHERIGFKGQSFKCYKFRSMVANSDEILREHLAGNAEAAREWQDNHKLKNDPRITFLGALLRKSSIDELPQLFNVLKGQMSCIGPRPIVQDELWRYGASVGDYLATRPGLTGLWQVTGRSSTDYARRVELDSYYVHNWSLWVDVKILIRTVFAVMRFDEAA
ncbi:sugar transferase [Aminobacter sp. HY435]|uniref:sugar transferase n=1 Tax=Aminobacter sp. HY435 TaxID=2970917 RepID=UPI0022B95904|nr:sugar transferase [Aminobacter sp. HY435]